jgi:hypothetical protein
MTRRFAFAIPTVVAGAVAVALILRPTRSIPTGPELGTPARIPAAMQAVIKSKMLRHGEQMRDLVMRVVVLDYDGVARAAGQIFDEPTLARPLAADDLNGVLPEQFFTLQAALRGQARDLVAASAAHDPQRLSKAFAGVTGSCLSCHDVYLRGD